MNWSFAAFLPSNIQMSDYALPTVSCPQCGKEHSWDTKNRFRPFCSERCKLIDLGKWANEEYRVAESSDEEDFSEPPHQA